MFGGSAVEAFSGGVGPTWDQKDAVEEWLEVDQMLRASRSDARLSMPKKRAGCARPSD